MTDERLVDAAHICKFDEDVTDGMRTPLYETWTAHRDFLDEQDDEPVASIADYRCGFVHGYDAATAELLAYKTRVEAMLGAATRLDVSSPALKDETAAIRAERDEALRVLRELVESATAMKEAIATCDPMEFGIGGGNGDTHWLIRDELIGRSDKALAAASSVLGEGE